MTTYATLQADIGTWLARGTLTAVIPSFIRSAEARIRRDVRHWKMLKRSTASGNNTRFLELPPRFMSMKRFKIVSVPETKPLTWRAADQLDVVGASQRAWNFAVHEELEFDYAVPQTTTVEMLYYASYQTLSATATTHWQLANAYDLYLYGALAESAPYLRDDERVPVWGTRYALARDALNEEERSHRGTGTRSVQRSPAAMDTP